MSNKTNSLAHASSPYLRSAMHQPIEWHEWGEQAFAKARSGNKPVLLDVGAVWCHWCHVMDRESYDNAGVAELINREFVAIKVDRDERPDVDSRYQAAVQAISGQGGWPLTAFLTPDGRPFYGGTYFPPDDAMGRPGFPRILMAVATAYREKHGEVLQSADTLMNVLAQSESFAGAHGVVEPQIVEAIIRSAHSNYDAEHGGFSNAPKFPHPGTIDLLLDHYAHTGNSESRDAALTTLQSMARGGVYDQLGGGFHRYSVDAQWIVPHFEKMSYDNSELLKNYIHAFQVTGDGFFVGVARDIIRWMDAVLSDRVHGGFYTSQDADINLEDDGDYFTWTRKEAEAVLTAEEFQAASLHFDIEEIGEMHHNQHKNVLYQHSSFREIAGRTGWSEERVRELIEAAKEKMYAARLERPTPYVDKTIYTGWNALCVSAYLEAARVLGFDEARRFALHSLDRILGEAWNPENSLKHVIAYSDPAAKMNSIPGLLDDYAYTVLACLDAYEATADRAYFNFARRIADRLLEGFWDPAHGGFFDTETGTPEQQQFGALVTRRKPLQDAPTPAGNPSAAIVLLRLHAYTDKAIYRERAQQTLEAFAGRAAQFGMFAATYGIAATLLSRPHTQVVVVGKDALADELLHTAVRPFSLGKTVLRLSDDKVAPRSLPPALADTVPNLPGVNEGKSVAVVCSNFTCQPPVSDPEKLAAQLREALIGSPVTP